MKNLYIKFYLHGLSFFLVCLAVSIIINLISSTLDLIIFTIFLFSLPLLIGVLNRYLTIKFYSLNVEFKILNMYCDGLIIIFILFPLSYFLSLTELSNSTLLILISNLVTPLILGFIMHKISFLIYHSSLFKKNKTLEV